MAGRVAVAIVTVLSVLLTQQAIVSVDADLGTATYYGGQNAQGTNNGACGYTNVFSLGYGYYTTALSDALFKGGRICGACYNIRCTSASACNGGSITVTVTNRCPQGSYGGWCNGLNRHFDLSYTAFARIAIIGAGHVPLSYQKVSCSRSGGIKFWIQGHTYFFLTLVYNVGGSGDIISVSVKGSRSGNWITMKMNWGVNYSTPTVLDGQGLSFAVKGSDGRTSYSNNCVGSGWKYGQTFSGSNF